MISYRSNYYTFSFTIFYRSTNGDLFNEDHTALYFCCPDFKLLWRWSLTDAGRPALRDAGGFFISGIWRCIYSKVFPDQEYCWKSYADWSAEETVLRRIFSHIAGRDPDCNFKQSVFFCSIYQRDLIFHRVYLIWFFHIHWHVPAKGTRNYWICDKHIWQY